MRRGRGLLKLAIAGVLGAAVPVLVACGSGGANLIPAANAGPLQSDFNAIADAVARGNCADTQSALSKAQTDVANLPATIDARLRQRIQQGLADLETTAPRQCQANTTTSTTSTTNTQTTTTTQTTPTTTTTTPTTTTPTTTAPPTTTTPTTTSTGPLPDNGGGTPGPSGAGAGSGGGSGSGGAGAGGTP